jgi:hypothetical protein
MPIIIKGENSTKKNKSLLERLEEFRIYSQPEETDVTYTYLDRQFDKTIMTSATPILQGGYETAHHAEFKRIATVNLHDCIFLHAVNSKGTTFITHFDQYNLLDRLQTFLEEDPNITIKLLAGGEPTQVGMSNIKELEELFDNYNVTIERIFMNSRHSAPNSNYNYNLVNFIYDTNTGAIEVLQGLDSYFKKISNVSDIFGDALLILTKDPREILCLNGKQLMRFLHLRSAKDPIFLDANAQRQIHSLRNPVKLYRQYEKFSITENKKRNTFRKEHEINLHLVEKTFSNDKGVVCQNGVQRYEILQKYYDRAVINSGLSYDSSQNDTRLQSVKKTKESLCLSPPSKQSLFFTSNNSAIKSDSSLDHKQDIVYTKIRLI